MNTKSEIIKQLKIDHPTIQLGDDEQGYKNLDPVDYEATILEWSNTIESVQFSEQASNLAKISAEAKLAALGLTADDLKALGL